MMRLVILQCCKVHVTSIALYCLVNSILHLGLQRHRLLKKNNWIAITTVKIFVNVLYILVYFVNIMFNI